ncbi:L-lysine 6-monooxygenase [Yersinia intermedia ATCC 29909]|nr:L-lysine 6-monooxygenase [Yersinia intermedia ATCC 29909]
MAIWHHHAGVPGKVRFTLKEFAVKARNFAAEGGNTEVKWAYANADEI